MKNSIKFKDRSFRCKILIFTTNFILFFPSFIIIFIHVYILYRYEICFGFTNFIKEYFVIITIFENSSLIL
ncbi:Uncharacterised protein [Campylobacter ureolyticus]|uniref:Uncharacterized protein n=1 Tax=Campylobacter ureolyticus TaxID=827 RepID=A0AAE7JP96_9BACT|nr:hypothetical protein CURT_0673 [Campylobacter ureolyticus]SUX23860.1 Uncharacterised protein [Campylobacter ureolyticus]